MAMTIEQYNRLPRPAFNACGNCRFIETCGYSPRRYDGDESEPCVLGLMSSGQPFFQPKN